MDGLSKVRNLITSGKRKEAWGLLNEILTRNPQNEAAWSLAYSLVDETKKELLLEKAKQYVPALDLALHHQQHNPLEDLSPKKKSHSVSIEDTRSDALRRQDLETAPVPQDRIILESPLLEEKTPTISKFLVYLAAIAMVLGALLEWNIEMFQAATGLPRKFGSSIGLEYPNGVLVILLGIGILIALSILHQKHSYWLAALMGATALIFIISSPVPSREYWGEQLGCAMRNAARMHLDSLYGESSSPAPSCSYRYTETGFGYRLSIWASLAALVFSFWAGAVVRSSSENTHEPLDFPT